MKNDDVDLASVAVDQSDPLVNEVAADRSTQRVEVRSAGFHVDPVELPGKPGCRSAPVSTSATLGDNAPAD